MFSFSSFNFFRIEKIKHQEMWMLRQDGISISLQNLSVIVEVVSPSQVKLKVIDLEFH
jgi:hypothetical protein